MTEDGYTEKVYRVRVEALVKDYGEAAKLMDDLEDVVNKGNYELDDSSVDEEEAG